MNLFSHLFFRLDLAPLVAIVLICSLPLFSQSEAATVSGTITDQTGAVVAGAEVQLTNVLTGITATTRSNEAGLYVFPAVHPSQYRMTVDKPGFRQVVLTDLTVNVQDTLSRNFILKVGVVGESVMVTGDVVKINTESASVSTLVDSQFVDNMPLNGRSFQSLIFLTPGMVVTPANSQAPGQFSTNGQRTNTNYVTIDGVSANFGSSAGSIGGQAAFGTATAYTAAGGTNGLISVDAMQEFRVQTSTYAPEFGRSPGAQISIVSKSGSNQWHGTAFDYFRNDFLDARNYFNNAHPVPDPVDPTTTDPAEPKAALRQNDFGGIFSGPIWKDRTFFFFSYEGLRLRQPQAVGSEKFFDAATKAAIPSTSPWAVIVNATPTGVANEACDAAQTFPCIGNTPVVYSSPGSFNTYSLRLDQKITDKIMVFARLNYSPSESKQYFDASTTNLIAYAETGTVGITALLTPSLANDFRANFSKQWSYLGASILPLDGAVIPAKSSLVPSGWNGQVYYIPSFSIDASPLIGPFNQGIQRQYNFVDTLSKTVGTHQLKFGVDFRRMKPTEVAGAQLDIMDFSWSDLVNGNVGYLSNTTSDQITAHINNWSLFGQDTWRAAPKLTLTYGLRWEINTPPASDTSGKPLYNLSGVFDTNPVAFVNNGLWSTQLTAFAPRFGAAYQVTSKTVIRGGFGMFYDLGYGGNVSQVMGGSSPYTRNVTAFDIPLDFSYTDDAGVNPYQPAAFSLIPSFNLTAVDPKLRLPFTLQWNVAVERELGRNESLTATYVGANGRRLLRADTVLTSQTGVVAFATHNAGTSDYNALQLQYMRRMSHGLQALVSYSYSHANDMGSDDLGYTGATSISSVKLPPMTPAAFDVRYSFSAALSYELPKMSSGGKAGKTLLNGWAMDTVYRLQGASPIDVYYEVLDSDTASYLTIRPKLTDSPIWISASTQPAGKEINLNAFTLNDPILVSNDTLRNSLRSPYRINQVDFALRRRFSITERVKLDLRAEYFNLLNHPMFTNPSGDMGTCYAYTASGCTSWSPNQYFGIVYYDGNVTGSGTLNNGLGAGATGGGGGQSAQYAVGGNRSAQLTLKLSF